MIVVHAAAAVVVAVVVVVVVKITAAAAAAIVVFVAFSFPDASECRLHHYLGFHYRLLRHQFKFTTTKGGSGQPNKRIAKMRAASRV